MGSPHPPHRGPLPSLRGTCAHRSHRAGARGRAPRGDRRRGDARARARGDPHRLTRRDRGERRCPRDRHRRRARARARAPPRPSASLAAASALRAAHGRRRSRRGGGDRREATARRRAKGRRHRHRPRHDEHLRLVRRRRAAARDPWPHRHEHHPVDDHLRARWRVPHRAARGRSSRPPSVTHRLRLQAPRRPHLSPRARRRAHFAYELAEAEGQRFGVRIDDRVIAMDTIAARVLDEVRATAEAYLKQPVEAAVITVPAYFSEVQREAIRRAAAQAKLAVHRIVNEPTAAAVAYGHKQTGSSRVAVWDFGGGTFDISVVDLSTGKLEVVATGGDNFLGGSDFDDLVANHLLAEFQRVEGISLDPTPQQVARLRQAAEQAKHLLSVDDEASVELPELVAASSAGPRRDLRLTLSRDVFDALTRPLVDRTLAIATEVLETRGLSPKDVDDVVLVGGTTRIPAVQRAVQELFGRRPSKRINPDEAVAHGAALLADELGKTPTLLDILPMSVGRGGAHRRFEPIVTRHARLPIRREIVLDADVLGSVQLPLFQGESSDVAQCEYLCTVLVEDRSLWDRGRVRLALSFDEHCCMSVEAWDARSGAALAIRLDRTRPVEEVLRDLGLFEGPVVETWQLPETPLGRILGRLSRFLGRRS
ncbi:MAG: Hsp70 family protein [Sandaracinaceae bacterium]|nr:Hsp70 family protein [Sandaracinaceae bacterium]